MNGRRPAPRAVHVGGIAAHHYAPHLPEGVDAGGPPIVLIHGAMDRSAGFRRTAVQLPDREIVTYDRRGYGDSHALTVATALRDHVDDLDAVCELIDERPLLVGHSLGGLIALLALARRGLPGSGTAAGAVGAVVWESPLAWNDWYVSRGDRLATLNPADAAESFMRSVIGDRMWERLPERVRAERRAEGPALVSDLLGSRRPDAEVEFARVEVPVVVGCGTRTAAYHERSAREAAAALPDARLVVVEGADHGIHLSDPVTFAGVISSWG